MNQINETNQPAPVCRCGGETRFIGIQRYAMLDYQRPLFDCQTCGTTLSGDKEALTEAEPTHESKNPPERMTPCGLVQQAM